jgi:uncharacterized membrane protein YesL
MGLFTRYDQEGPGVYEDEPVRGPFVRFFQTYSQRFLKLCVMNLMFVVVNIPSIIIAYIGAAYFLPLLNPVLSPVGFTKYVAQFGITSSQADVTPDGASMQLFFLLILLTVMFVVGSLLVSCGPVQAGLSYIYRNFARNTTSLFWPDFVAAVKANWKQSLVASLISIVVGGIILMNIAFYNGTDLGGPEQVLATVFSMVFVFFLCIQMYVYPLIATVDLKMRQIYRNAILFFIGRFIPNMGIFLVNVLILIVLPVIMLLSFTKFGLSIAMFYYAFFAFSFVHYLNTFFVWQQIDRYIVKPQQEAADKLAADEELADENDGPVEDSKS